MPRHPFRNALLRSGLLMASLVFLRACGGSAPTTHPGRDLPPSTRPGGFARLSSIEAADPSRGDLESGSAGDWVLENDRIRVVVGDTPHRGGFSEGGGNILDAAPRGGPDLLREIFTYFDDTFPRQAVYAGVGPGPRDSRGGVSLIARGRDSRNSDLDVETKYSLDPGSSVLVIRTSVRNRGTEAVAKFELGDAIEWGRATAFGPGVGDHLAGRRPRLPFLLGYGEGTSYAWVSPEGDLEGPHGGPWSDPIVKTVDLSPGDSTTYVRHLIVATSAAEAAAMAWQVRGISLGELTLDLELPGDRPSRSAQFEVRASGGEPILAGYFPDDAPTGLRVPIGEVVVAVRHPSRGFAESDEIRVREGRESRVSLELPEPATLRLRARDASGAPSPARWTFEGTGDTPNPDFGPRHTLSGSGPVHFTPGGEATVDVPPGTYRVTVTRGPAYQAWIADLDLQSGKIVEVEATLTPLGIPPAWVSADFHVHAVPSFDSPVSLADRAGSLVCEGIEWFAATDHTHRTDYGAVLGELELAAPLHALVSEEITTARFGHFGAFPVPHRPGEPGNGAVIPEGLTPDDIFNRLRGEGESVLIQVNHPRAGSNGYFDLLEYSAQDDTAAAGFRRDFDLLEILNGKTNPNLEELWSDWISLLKSGDPVTAVGNSDTHWIQGQEPGVPRNFVWLDPSGGNTVQDKLVEAVRTGRVVVSNGPFVEFTLGGVGVGGTAAAANGTIRGHIRVLAPSWVDVRRVRVYLNGREQSTFMARGRGDAVRFDEDFELSVNRPSFVIVRVEGDDPMDPVVPAERVGDRFIPVLPIAITNPIWVETSARRP